MKILSLLSLAVLGILGSVSAARATFTPIPQPDAAYLAATSVLELTDPDFSALSSLSNGSFSVAFSTDLVALTVPDTWTTWGSPPNTESSTPRVLWTQGATSLTLDLSNPVGIFGVELQPNTGFPSTGTADFYSYGNLVGSITLDVDGNGGARLFAGQDNPPITSVIFNVNDDFAISRIRFGAVVPEPGAVALLFGMSGGLLLLRRRR
jgi:hypothetical protein